MTVNEILEASKELGLTDVLVIGTKLGENGAVQGLELNTTISSGLGVTHLLHKVLLELSSEHIRTVMREAQQNMGETNV